MAILLAGAIWFDQSANDGAISVFLGRKLVDLIDWVAFWR